MGRLIEADAFSAFIKDAVIKHKYDRLNIDNTLTVADVLQSVCAELDGTGLEGFKNAPTVDAVEVVRKPVKGYEGYYEVDQFGRVYALDRIVHVSDNGREYDKPLKGGQMKQHMHSKGYKTVVLTKSDYWCECGWHLGKMGDVNYCPNCGKKVKWDG